MVTAALHSVFAQETAAKIESRWDDLAASLAERCIRASGFTPREGTRPEERPSHSVSDEDSGHNHPLSRGHFAQPGRELSRPCTGMVDL